MPSPTTNRLINSRNALTPSLDFNFSSGVLPRGIVCSRSSSATYFDSTGTLQTASSNVARIDYNPNTLECLGFLIEGSATNYLLNSDAPATQTTGSLATGTYTLWIAGTGSATSSAGTATGSGFGTATNGSPNTFTLTEAGTVVVTVSGSPTRFQLENNPLVSSYIPTTGTTATRSADNVTYPLGAWFNGMQGSIVVTASVEGFVTSTWIFSLNVTSANGFGLFYNSNQSELGVSGAGDSSVSFTVNTNTFYTSACSYNTYVTRSLLTTTGLVGNVGNQLVALPSINVLTLGNRGNSTRYLNGHLKKFTYYPVELPVSTLRILSGQ